MLQQWLEQNYFYGEGINSCCSDTLLSINGWYHLAEADVAWYCSSSSHRWHAMFGQWSTKRLVFQILWCDYGCLSYMYNEGCNSSSFQLTEITIPVMIRYRLFVTNWHPTYVLFFAYQITIPPELLGLLAMCACHIQNWSQMRECCCII